MMEMMSMSRESEGEREDVYMCSRNCVRTKIKNGNRAERERKGREESKGRNMAVCILSVFLFSSSFVVRSSLLEEVQKREKGRESEEKKKKKEKILICGQEVKSKKVEREREKGKGEQSNTDNTLSETDGSLPLFKGNTA